MHDALRTNPSPSTKNGKKPSLQVTRMGEGEGTGQTGFVPGDQGSLGAADEVAVLFARSDSIYKSIPGCDVYDIERDARTWPGGCPVIAHPPCRAWGAFAMFAKPRHDEKDLAPWSIEQIRKYGGVLEHPYASKLWPHMGLPEQGKRDEFGGFTLVIHQHWFGHRAEKKTKLYICGVDPWDIPDFPMVLGTATHVIGDVGRASNGTKRPEVSKEEREHTPPELAKWLVDLARSCKVEVIA